MVDSLCARLHLLKPGLLSPRVYQPRHYLHVGLDNPLWGLSCVL
jgi:hypothetical protein